MRQVTFSTGSIWTYGLNRAFEIAAKTGFDAVEVIIDDRWDTRQPGYLHRLMDETEVKIASLHAPFAALRGSKSYRAGVIAAMELADQVGARTVVVHPESRGKGYGNWLRENWAELHQGHRAELAVENMPYWVVKTRPRHRTHRPEQLLRFPSATVDTAHFGLAGVDILEALDVVAPRLKHIHLSDSKKKKEHLCPGDGELPIKPFLQKLVGMGFDGDIVLELSPEGLPVKDENAVVNRLRAVREQCVATLAAEHAPTRQVATIGAG